MAIDFPDSPTVDQQYSVGDRTWTWNGTYWQLSQTSSTFTASDTAPVSPSAGDIWFESDTGQTFVYYDQSWVEIGAATDLSDILSDADADTSVQVEASSDEDTIRFKTAGVERLHLTSGGHLVPQANVTYDLGSASNRFRDLYLSGSSIDLGGVEITSDGTSLTMPPVSNISGDFTVDTDTLHVDSANDRVGIGTATPTYTLDAQGQVQVGAGDDITPDASGNGHLMIDGAGYSGFASLDGTAMWVGHNSGSRSLNLATNETARITVTGGGNVGVGDTSPSYTLDVNGDINTTGNLRFQGTVGYTYVQTLYFTSSGTFTKASYPWLRAVRVRAQGGGGGGGSSIASYSGGGAGGGAYAEGFITDIAGISSIVTVTVGSGGAGGTTGNDNAADGGSSSFGSDVIAVGGDGGQYGSGVGFGRGIGGRGGDAASCTGDIAFSGSGGGAGGGKNARQQSGAGGGSHLGGGGRGYHDTAGSDVGAPGFLYGGGGGGAPGGNSSGDSGGSGAAGLVILELFA